jgi:hypothetical protein
LAEAAHVSGAIRAGRSRGDRANIDTSYFPAQKAGFRTRGLGGAAENKKARRVMPAGR